MGNLMFDAYFELLYPFQVTDSLRTLNVHHCFPWLSLTIIYLVSDNGESDV